MTRAWREVTKAEPCPICGRPDWCSRSIDGAWVVCRRVNNGDGLHRVDRSGADYWLYRLGGGVVSEPSTEILESPGPERADDATLYKVYTSLLQALSLSPEHRDNLRCRGLTDEEIDRRRYRSLPRKGRAAIVKKLLATYPSELLLKVPGFYVRERDGKRWIALAGPPGILIPVRDLAGQIVALKIRLDVPKGDTKYVYLSSRPHHGPGPGSRVHHPVYSGETNVARLTEGELKADVATALSGIRTLSIPGASCYRPAIPALEAMGAKNVLLAFDADARENRNVARALRDTANALIEKGFTVSLEVWDRAQGKGIDDLLAAGGKPRVLEGDAALDEVAAINEEAMRRDPAPIAVQINHTDLGNARRLVGAHGKDLRFCHPWGKWLVWDGRRWEVDSTAEVNRRAKDVVRLMYAEAAEAQDVDWRKALVSWATRSESQSRIEAMINSAKSEPGIPVRPEELDRDPWLFNCLNGTLDLRTGALRAHAREDLLTKIAPVEYVPDAQCPAWLDFLDLVFGGDDDVISFVQRAVGYSLTGITDERVFFILYGEGRNGKTTFLETIAALMGDYAEQTPTETLLAVNRNSSGIPNDVARLKGARFVRASEAERGHRLAEAKVKAMVGGDMISARFLRAEWFTFRPMFKLWLSTNHRPTARANDTALWDRIRLIPFTKRIESPRPRREIDAIFRAEFPGILAWAVRGCLEWQRDGLGIAEAVAQATDDYRARMDVVASFLRECCHVREDLSVPCKELYEAFATWAEANGESVWSSKAFAQRMNELGFIASRGSGGSWRRWGLTLIDTSHEEPEPFPALLVAGGNGNGKDPF